MGAVRVGAIWKSSINLAMPMLGDNVEFNVCFSVFDDDVELLDIECVDQNISIDIDLLMDTQRDYVIKEIQKAIYEEGFK